MIRPDVAPPAPWRFAEPTIHQFDNGIRLLAYHQPHQHIASLVGVIEAPLCAEPHPLEGLATIALHCLDEGSMTHPADTYSAVLEDHGASVGGHHALTGAEFSIDFPISRLAAVAQLFAEALIEPELANDVVARNVALRLANIEQHNASPTLLAGRHLRRVLFDNSSRAQRPNGGDPHTVGAITGDDVRAWHQRHYRPAHTTIIISGDVTGPEVVDTVGQAFSAWGGHSEQPRHETPQFAPTTHRLIDRPGSVQSVVTFGIPGIDRTHRHWADLLVAIHALGGSFGSRLNTVLREEKGWTYGSHFQATGLRRSGFVHGGGSFRTEVTVPAIEHARDILDLRSAPLTEAEITDARNYLLGTAPMRFATADAVAAQAAQCVQLGLDVNWINEHFRVVESVTAESATAAYQDLCGDWRLVVVGDAEELADPLRAAGWDVDRVPTADGDTLD